MQKWFILLLSFALTGQVGYVKSADSKHSSFKISFGEINKTPIGDLLFKKETTDLKYRFRQDGYYFGVVIEPRNIQPYKVQFVHHLPAPPHERSGRLVNAELTNQGKTIKGKPHYSEGISIFPFGLDQGDSPGNYRVEVYVDDELMANISFNIK